MNMDDEKSFDAFLSRGLVPSAEDVDFTKVVSTWLRGLPAQGREGPAQRVTWLEAKNLAVSLGYPVFAPPMTSPGNWLVLGWELAAA
jgi:hypothetical protein